MFREILLLSRVPHFYKTNIKECLRTQISYAKCTKKTDQAVKMNILKRSDKLCELSHVLN